MRIVKGKTGCLCHNCDNRESEYMIENYGSFKVFWAREVCDCEIAFCDSCAKSLLEQLAEALGAKLEYNDDNAHSVAK